MEGVHPDGIAQRAGLRIGDTLMEWDGLGISDTQRPWKFFKGKESGKLTLQFLRDEEVHCVDVACAFPLNNSDIENRIAQLLGLQKEGDWFTRIKPVLSDNPLVSVLVHAYKPTWFREAIQSVLEQTYSNIEIIIGDDNSKGEIRAIVDELIGDDPRCRYYLHSPPLRGWGAGNRYFCFAKAKGELIKYLCDDDVLHPTCIEKMVQVLQMYPEVSLVTSHRRSINGQGAQMNPINPARRLVHYDSIIDGIRATNVFHGFGHNAIGEPTTTMFRRAQVNNPFYVDTVGGVQAESGLDDVSLWCSLLAKGKLFYFAEALSSFRISDQQGTVDKRLMKDVHWRLLRLNRVFYEIGTLGCPLEFRQNPLIVSAEVKDEGMELTALGVQRMLLDSSVQLNRESQTKLVPVLRKFHDWPKLQFLLSGKLNGRFLPTSLKKCVRITNKLKTSLFVSDFCPLVLNSMVHKKTYFLYFPSLGFLHNLLCRVQFSDGGYHHQLTYSINQTDWKSATKIGEQWLIELDEKPIEHLVELRGIQSSGEGIVVGKVQVISVVPLDVDLHTVV